LVCGQLFFSLFFFDIHRTNFSNSAGPFTSFDPVGFAIFANLRQPASMGRPCSRNSPRLLLWMSARPEYLRQLARKWQRRRSRL
jgi:hypothetical protein